MKTLTQRLKDGALENKETGCIEWQRHCNADGYGMLWLNKKTERTHRASWIAHSGEIPEGMHVLHKCDNRKCVNPEHLFLGTNADNVADKVAKNRQSRVGAPKGEKCGASKLTLAQVQAIRIWLQTGLSYTKIAKKFDVSFTNIAAINTRRSWKHI